MLCKNWQIIILILAIFLISFGYTSPKTCPRSCDCIETLLITNCSESYQLEYVPHTLNPALKELFLPKNNIRRIDSAFDVYKNLIFLDLSSNLITTIIDGNFKFNSKLKIILLKNNSITYLHLQAFTGLESLKKLDLSFNQIETFNESVFKSLHVLEVLDLSFNNLKILNGHTFFGLKNLRHLNMSNNLMINFSSNLFANVKNLIHLNVSFNNLEQVNDDWFLSLNQLMILDLSSCKINLMSDFCLRGLYNLTTLYLQNNSLTVVPSAIFLRNNIIQVLNIGQNFFKSILANSFSSLKHLKRFYLNNAPLLNDIHSNAFSGLESLEMFELTNNTILKHIRKNAFDSLVSLSSLLLFNNSFTTLEIDLVTRYKKFDLYLDVRGNPFNCNCSLEWLNFHLIRMFNKTISSNPEYFLKNNISLPIYKLDNLLSKNFSEVIIERNALDVRCRTPYALKDKIIIKLNKDKFGCFAIETFVPIVAGGMIGFLIIMGVSIMLFIQCRNQLSGFVKNQLYTENNKINQFDLYQKPEFIFISNYAELYRSQKKIEELSLRHPLKLTPTTEL